VVWVFCTEKPEGVGEENCAVTRSFVWLKGVGNLVVMMGVAVSKSKVTMVNGGAVGGVGVGVGTGVGGAVGTGLGVGVGIGVGATVGAGVGMGVGVGFDGPGVCVFDGVVGSAVGLGVGEEGIVG